MYKLFVIWWLLKIFYTVFRKLHVPTPVPCCCPRQDVGVSPCFQRRIKEISETLYLIVLNSKFLSIWWKICALSFFPSKMHLIRENAYKNTYIKDLRSLQFRQLQTISHLPSFPLIQKLFYLNLLLTDSLEYEYSH